LIQTPYEQPETGIPSGSTVDVFGRQFTSTSEIIKTENGYRIAGAGLPDNAPAGMYTVLNGDFVLEAKLNIHLDGATAGQIF